MGHSTNAWKLLEKDEIAERMAFGVPGWDYYLAATLSRREVGGAIMDGPFFWHQSHKTTYGNVDQFASYLPEAHRDGACHFVRRCRSPQMSSSGTSTASATGTHCYHVACI